MPLLQQCEQTAKLAPAWQDKTVEQLAWPVFYSGYAILVNEQALYSVGLSPPLDIEDMDQAYLQQVQQALPNAFAYETKQAGLAAMGAQMNEQTRQAIVQGGSGTRAQFLKRGDRLCLPRFHLVYHRRVEQYAKRSLLPGSAIVQSGSRSAVCGRDENRGSGQDKGLQCGRGLFAIPKQPAGIGGYWRFTRNLDR